MIPNYFDQIKKSLDSLDYNGSNLHIEDFTMAELISPETFNYLVHDLICQNRIPLYIIYYPEENLISVPSETNLLDLLGPEDFSKKPIHTWLHTDVFQQEPLISLTILLGKTPSGLQI